MQIMNFPSHLLTRECLVWSWEPVHKLVLIRWTLTHHYQYMCITESWKSIKRDVCKYSIKCWKGDSCFPRGRSGITRLTQTLMRERRWGKKEMIGCRCNVKQIPSIRLLAASHSTCRLNTHTHTHTHTLDCCMQPLRICILIGCSALQDTKP